MTGGAQAVVAACAFFAAPLADRLGRRWAPRAPRALVEAAGPVGLIALAAAVYEPLVRGRAPTTYDHGYGMLKAVETADLLHRHRLFGWSDFEAAGYPAHMHYPMGGALLEAALGSLPHVSVDSAHAWCVWLAMVSMTLACYLAGRLAYGKATGCAAGVLGLLDPGAWWVGGHLSAVDVGMWIQSVSTAFVIAGLSVWPLAVQRRSAALVVLAGWLFGVAIVFHPQAILLGGAAGVVMLLALASSPGLGVRAILGYTAGIPAVALFTSAFWLVQYIANRDTSDLPKVEPERLTWVWEQVVAGGVLRGPAIWVGAALAGWLLVAQRSDPFSRFLAIAVPGLAIVFTGETLDRLHLRAGPGSAADTLQLMRMFYLQRPLTFLLAGYALGPPLWRAIGRVSGPGASAGSFVVRVVAALLVWAFFQIPDVTFPGIPKPARPTWLSPANEANMAAAFDLAASRMKPGDRLLTHVDDEFNNGLILPAAERHRKVFKIGIPAAIMFKNQFSTEDLELLQRTGGTVLASMGPLPPRLDALPKVGAFGPFEVRTLPGLPRAWLDGPGELEIVSFEDDAVRVRIRGSSARTRLRLGIAFFKTWRADDGTPATPFAFREATLTELRAHDGEMVVRYHAPLSQPVGLAISLLGWGGLLAWGGHRWSRRRKLPRPAEA